MDIKNFCLIVAVPALLCILQAMGVEGIQCYHCENCPQPFDPKGVNVTVVTCQGSCYTTNVTRHSTPTVATRRCEPGATQNGCGSSGIHGQFETSYCYCSYRDLCNGGPYDPNSSPTLMTSVTAVLSFIVAQIIIF